MTMLVALTTLVMLAACSADAADDQLDVTAQEEARVSVLPVVEETEWGDGVGIELLPHSWTIDSDGIPNHKRQSSYPFGPADQIADATNSATVADPTATAPLRITLPLEPELAAEPAQTAPGPIGLLITGARLHNPYEDGATAFAIEQNFSLAGAAFVDVCNGHPSRDGSYHYHGNPTCVTNEIDSPGVHSVVLGFLFDGFPVYGPQDIDGAEPGDLDECNGHIGPTPEAPSPSYHYHLSTVPPYSPTCYSGIVDPVLVAGQGTEGAGDELCVLNPEAANC